MLRVAACIILVVASSGTLRSSTASPVEKVVQLLQGLKDQIRTDGKAESNMVNKYFCWCHDLLTDKSSAITQANADLKATSQDILANKAAISVLTNDISGLQKTIADTTDAQEEATNIRQKEFQRYTAETSEMKTAMKALTKAINVLHDGQGALLQVSGATAAATIKSVIQALPWSTSLPEAHLSLLSEVATSGARYAPQSETINGMLQQMFEQFAQNIEGQTFAEAQANFEFEQSSADANKLIKESEESKASKESERADKEQALASALALFQQVTEQKAADSKLFDATTDSCTHKKTEWDYRQSNRTRELQGIDEALKILTDDSARAIFDSASTSFLQTGRSNSVTAENSNKAYDAVRSRAVKTHSLRLARIAMQIRREASTGHFDTVVAAIDKMVNNLHDEERRDTHQRDECIDNYKKIDVTVEKETWNINRANKKIDSLDAQQQKIRQKKQATLTEISQTRLEIQELEDQHNEEQSEYNKETEESNAMISLLKAAHDKLTAYYDKEGLLQEPKFARSADQAPDATLSSSGSRAGESNSIATMMANLVDTEEKEVEKETEEMEESTKAFLAQKQDMLDTIDKLNKKVEELDEMHADRGEKKNSWKTDHLQVAQADLDAENAFKRHIQPDCDWILGAFEERLTTRKVELSGLIQAKEFLEGMNEALVQKGGRGLKVKSVQS